MPVRTAYAGAAVSGEVLTAANVNKMPGGWIGHSEATASQAGITAETALTNLSVTVTVGTARRLRITVMVRLQAAGGGDSTVTIKEGATLLTNSSQTLVAGKVETVMFSAVITPTAGAHTYNSTLGSTSSTDSNASATIPAFILVEDIGPAT